MLYLGYVLLRCVLIYNLEVSFNFRLLFLQLNVIKMFIVQQKLFFTLLSAIFFGIPITRTFKGNRKKVRVIGSRLYASFNINIDSLTAVTAFTSNKITKLAKYISTHLMPSHTVNNL